MVGNINETKNIINKEGHSLIGKNQVEKRPQDIKKEREQEHFIKRQSDALIKGFESVVNKAMEELKIPPFHINIPDMSDKVQFPDNQKIHGEVKAQVKFPETQKVEGGVDVKNFPEVQKVEGEVKLKGFQFPDFKKIFTDALKAFKIDFPETQKIEGKVAVDFPKVQKVEGSVTATIPMQKGKHVKPADYMPVRLTDGEKFYVAVTQGVQSNGRVVEALERAIVELKGLTVTVGDVGIDDLPDLFEAQMASIAATISGNATQTNILNSLPAGNHNIGNIDIESLPGTAQADIASLATAIANHLPTTISGVLSTPINNATSGDNEVIAAVAGKRIVVWAILLVSDGTVDVRLEDGAGGTALTGQMPLLVNLGFSHKGTERVPICQTNVNTALNLELNAAVNVHGIVSYTLVD